LIALRGTVRRVTPLQVSDNVVALTCNGVILFYPKSVIRKTFLSFSKARNTLRVAEPQLVGLTVFSSLTPARKGLTLVRFQFVDDLEHVAIKQPHTF